MAEDMVVYELPAGSPPGTTLTPYADFSTLDTAQGMVVVGNHLYVSDVGTGDIYYSSLGQTSGLPVGFSAFATGMPIYGGLATDGSNVFAVSGGGASVYRLAVSGGPYASPASWVDCSSLPSCTPYHITLDSEGNIFLSSANNSVLEIPSGSTTVEVYLPQVTAPGFYAMTGPLLAIGSDLFMVSSDPTTGFKSVLVTQGVVPPPTTTTTTSSTTTSGAVTTTSSGGSSLPSTGAPLGALSVAALSLIAGGLVMKRRSRELGSITHAGGRFQEDVT